VVIRSNCRVTPSCGWNFASCSVSSLALALISSGPLVLLR
jgi:hypothetical protein